MVKSIGLDNFRNFIKKSLEFSGETTVIIGPNASGKTNILESIFLLSTGKSFRARIEEEMINYKAEIARVKATVIKDDTPADLEVVLTRGEISLGEARVEKIARKRLLLNGTVKRLIDFSGNLKVVMFGPQHLGLVTESPSLRRAFLDAVLSQVDREYRRVSLSYEKGLRQRNRLLWQIREYPSTSSGRMRLLFWDRLLIKNGNYLSAKREEFINFVNQTPPLDNQEFSLEYDRSVISETRLEQYAEEEVAAATTLVGPHRDDFLFKVKGERQELKEKDLARFGSRGEQRMSVLWLKLAELSYVKKTTGEKPTLLLDDIFSELDHEHRDIVMKTASKQQTIITTADPHFVESFKKVEKIEIPV